jgi:7,8-dihydropterin-6-yl-methyl-4-(beta-D-ribofuranosyl)aminobenzene 5'-phosphate synthase
MNSISMKSPLKLTIVYDNNAFIENLRTDWGFSCFIKGLEKTILFDTGTRGDILLANMEKLGISPLDIDIVFLSHNHKDHTGGLEALLEINPKIQVWLPLFFPSDLKDLIIRKGASFVNTDNFKQIFQGAYTTGIITGWIKEQSLILESNKGLIIITGCAHPRITKIITLVKDLIKQNIHLVFGGFHLSGFEKHEINQIIAKFKTIEIEKVGPCHCSGDEARSLFHTAYADNYIKTGVGKEIII